MWSLPIICIGPSTITPVSAARELGISVDHHLSMVPQINQICKSATFSLRNIGRIRKYLSQSDCEKLVHAFVSSRLDFCNSPGFRQKQLDKLQRIQNSAARLVTRTKKYEHIIPVLCSLHWLPIALRIEFKILLLTYKAMNCLAPPYISELLNLYCPVRTLRSSESQLLQVPRTFTATYGNRTFSVCAPKLWNSLPFDVKAGPSLSTFKCRLKTSEMIFFKRFYLVFF